MTESKKTVVGLSEPVTIISQTKKALIARIDTGATKSSIDSRLAAELKLGPVIETKLVKSASGNLVRPVIQVRIELAGREIVSEFTLADRAHMKYKILIGQNILKKGFLIDPLKEE